MLMSAKGGPQVSKPACSMSVVTGESHLPEERGGTESEIEPSVNNL